MTTLALTLLGAFQVVRNDAHVSHFHSDKVRALLAYLIAEADRPHARARLAALLWPEQADSAALRNLSQTLVRLREVLGHTDQQPAPLRITVQSIQWIGDAAQVDVADFARLARSSDPHDLARAAALYQGEFLAGFALPGCEAFEEWLLLTREQFQQQALATLHTLAEQHLAAQHWTEAAACARRQLELDRWREDAHRQLMRALAGAGDRAAALAAYQRCEQILHDDLSIAPDAATSVLAAMIRAGTSLGANTAALVTPPASDVPTNQTPALTAAQSHDSHTWDETPQIATLYGRAAELAQLERWLAQERCQLVAVLGIGGVGKTTLAAAAVKAVSAQFDRVIWRSLLNAPPLAEVLRDILQRLTNQHLIDLPAGLDAQLALLIEGLRQQRCLLVLDNLESILDADQPGQMRPGYDGYAQLIQALAERRHRSCLLLTSREQPQGRALWSAPLVRSLPLAGLDVAAGQELLTARGLPGSAVAATALIERYSGNPLALKLVAQTVQDLFGNNIVAFLAAEAPIFDDIRVVLDQQFARLSALEREILIWLAIEREPISIQALRENLVDPGAPRVFLETLRGLQRRSLIEQNTHGCSLQNVVTEYLTEVLVDQVSREIVADRETGRQGDIRNKAAVSSSPLLLFSLSALNRYALLKATAKEYVRASQMRLIVSPLAQQLVATLGRARLVEKLKQIIASLQESADIAPGYAAGNILNLLLHLDIDVQGYDFSRLTIRQAYLQGAQLPNVNFRAANLAQSVFTYTFGDILAIHFEADGQLRVAGLAQGRINLWRAADGQLLREYQTFGAGASIATFSRDGRLLASGDTDHQVRLWDVARGQLLHTLSGHTETPWMVIFSPDGQTIASSGRDGTVQLWDVPTGRLRQTLQAHTTGMHALAFTLDSQTLASGDVDGIVRLWRLGRTDPLHTFQAHPNEVYALAFDATGTILASGSLDRTVRIWQVPADSGNIQALHTLHAHTQMIRRLVMSPDGYTVATSGHDSFVCLWDVRSGQALHTLVGHAYPIHHLAFSADGQTLATVGVDQTICLWDVANGQRLDSLQTHSGYIYALAFSPDGRFLVSGGADSIARLWNMHAAERVVQTFAGHAHGIYAVAFSPDGATLASGGRDKVIQIWDIRSGRSIRTLDGHTDDVESIQFSADGRWLVSASSDHSLRIWDVRSGQPIRALHGHTDRVRAGAISPDGQLIASASHDRTIRLWHVQTGQTTQILYGHTNGVKWVVFSRDGRLLASSSYDRTMRLWDVASGGVLYTWPAQNSTILSMAFHPDGERLATGATDNTVRLWAVQSGNLLATLRGHTDLIESVGFSPDGRWLVSGSADETIRLWDIATGACLHTLRADGPYAGLNIADITGISIAQKAALTALGAVEANDER